MLINSIHISLYDISLTQNILYQIKRDVAVWKRLGCPQRSQRTWWQIVATPYTGLALLMHLLNITEQSSKSSGLILCLRKTAINWPGVCTVYPKKYAHGFCFAVLCCGYTLTDFPISTRLTSLALWQSNDCPSASKATLMNMDKYFMWIHYERLHNHNKAKHNKTVCIFLGMYCISVSPSLVHVR